MSRPHAHAGDTRLDDPSPASRRAFGVFLVVLALFTVLSSVYFENQARESRECFERKISELTLAVEARGELATRSNLATQRVILSVATSRSQPEDEGRRTFEEALMDYSTTIEEIEAARKANPLPAFPPGACP